MLLAIKHARRVLRSILHERKKARSPAWRHVRDTHLAKSPICAACGGTKRVQVHHIEPYHLRPELELDPHNLVSLCMGEFECHLRIGHGDDFKAYNPTVLRHAAVTLRLPKKRWLVELEAIQIRLYEDP